MRRHCENARERSRDICPKPAGPPNKGCLCVRLRDALFVFRNNRKIQQDRFSLIFGSCACNASSIFSQQQKHQQDRFSPNPCNPPITCARPASSFFHQQQQQRQQDRFLPSLCRPPKIQQAIITENPDPTGRRHRPQAFTIRHAQRRTHQSTINQ